MPLMQEIMMALATHDGGPPVDSDERAQAMAFAIGVYEASSSNWERFAISRIGSDNANDALQSLFLKILDAAGELRQFSETQLRKWTFRVLTNIINDHHRQNRKERSSSESVAAMSRDLLNSNSTNQQADNVSKEFWEYAGTLSPPVRTVVDMKLKERQTFAKIGESLGYSRQRVSGMFESAINGFRRLKGPELD